jgi:PHD/YefM family antitoxin component YafN of YafNO toxin-antitoxin module
MRWVASRKAAVVRRIEAGELTPEAACDEYDLTTEELAGWRDVYKQHGQPGLQITRVQIYSRRRRQRTIYEKVPDMIKVSAVEFQRNIGKYQDAALTQPVVVARNGRERTVMISVEEYHRLKRRDRRVMGLEDFTDEDIAALEQTRAPEASRAFDSELKTS